MDLVLSSNNLHKVKEYQEILKEFKDINIKTLKDEGIEIDPKEDGLTFKDNSLIKALECQKYTNKIIISDDSGLIVDALPDILGVHTSRFMDDKPYPDRWLKVIELLEGKVRNAKFVCCITVLNLTKEPLFFIGECLGSISFIPEGSNGFGYDPIFIPKGYDKTFALLEEKEKNSISHRALASKQLVKYLKEHYESIVNK